MSRYYVIAGTIFVFNLVLGLLNAISFGYTAANDPTWSGVIVQQVSNANNYGSNPVSNAIYVFGDFVRSLPIVVQAFFYATVLLPYMLSSFYLPSEIVTVLSGIVYFSYLLAIVEFISGRDLK